MLDVNTMSDQATGPEAVEVCGSSSTWARRSVTRRPTVSEGQDLTAPIVKPVMKRSSSRLKTNAIGIATSTAAACSDCQ